MLFKIVYDYNLLIEIYLRDESFKGEILLKKKKKKV